MSQHPPAPQSPPAPAATPEPEKPRARIGQLLVDAGFVSARDLERALAQQAEEAGNGRRRKVGQILVANGRITETQLTQTLGMQLNAPWVSLTHVSFDQQLLDRVPAAVAQMYKLIPVYVRVVKGAGQTLYVAMDDPTNDKALTEVSGHARLPVKAMIASPADVHRAIRLHYFGEEPEDDAPEIEVGEVEIELRPRREVLAHAGPSTGRIQLLDGTSVEIPRRGSAPDVEPKTAQSPSAPMQPSLVPPPAPSKPPPPLPSKPPSTLPSVLPPSAMTTPSVSDRLERLRQGSEADRVLAATVTVLLKKGLVTEAELDAELGRGLGTLLAASGR